MKYDILLYKEIIMNYILGDISEDEAKELNADYVDYAKNTNFDLWKLFDMETIKRGNIVMVHEKNYISKTVEFKIVKVTSVGIDVIGELKVRVSDNKYSWRTESAYILT
jgi:hypothetical protein